MDIEIGPASAAAHDGGDPVLNPERFFDAKDEAGELIGFYSSSRSAGPRLRPRPPARLDRTGLGLEFFRAA